jgi:hypothetical protein
MFLPMFCGLSYLAFAVLRTSVAGLLGLFPLLIVVWIFRELMERWFGEQIVTVIPGKISWTIKTKWWTRHREFRDVQDISAHSRWDGFGWVVLRTRVRRYRILQWIWSEEASRLANELRHAINR